jgi:hypothetical protein
MPKATCASRSKKQHRRDPDAEGDLRQQVKEAAPT